MSRRSPDCSRPYLHASEALLGFANAPCLENTSAEDLIDAEIGRFDAMSDAVAEELAAMTSVRSGTDKTVRAEVLVRWVFRGGDLAQAMAAMVDTMAIEEREGSRSS
jgi:hypothetical protein